MKVFITGAAGFIGSHLAKSFLNDDFEVLGVDNINNYYDVNLKQARLKELSSFENFSFKKIDLIDKASLTSIFKEFKPTNVVNLAAQAGVRYSIQNPYAYMESNLIGFLNLIELCRHNEVDGFVYASSSSVYGSNKKIPFSVDDRVDSPIALYGASKRANELIAHAYSHLYNLNTTGLRYFTAYGPWGRPDMAMFIFAKKILNNEPIPVFNYGKMKRDFTYIDDIISGTRKAIDKNYKCEVFNLGNHKSEELVDMISLIEKELNKKAIKTLLPIQPGDIEESFADIKKSEKLLGYKPMTNIDIGIKHFISWFIKYYKI
jgi:UDP-glucuronate 4-epimerase